MIQILCCVIAEGVLIGLSSAFVVPSRVDPYEVSKKRRVDASIGINWPKKPKWDTPIGIDWTYRTASGSAVFSTLLEHVFDHAIVICYKENCAKHRPGGGMWPESVQDRIWVFDGHEIDQQYHGIIDNIDGPLHESRVWLSHLVAVSTASRLPINTLLVMEDDVIEVDFTEEHFAEMSSVHNIVGALHTHLASIPWQYMKLTAYYVNAYRKTGLHACNKMCPCETYAAWHDTVNTSSSKTSFIMCRTHPVCLFWSSAGYALHRSAFPSFLNALNTTIKEGRAHNDPILVQSGFKIDYWSSYKFEMLHLLPSLGYQQKKRFEYESGLQYKKSCATP